MPENLFDGSDRWLSINVNSDGEMTPRLRIVSVPYAIHAKTADTDNDWTINGSDMYSANSGYVGINDTTPSFQLDVNGDFRVRGILHDSAGDAGISGQVLSTTGTGTNWVDTVAEIDDLADGKTGGNSVFLGSGAGINDDGSDNRNVGIGIDALYTNSTGYHNTANGFQALYTNSTGNFNTANGFQALLYNAGSSNTAFGSYALCLNTSGQYNIGIGKDANRYNEEGSYNTIIGYKAGMGTELHNKSGNIFLGYRAGYSEAGDNKLYIDNSSTITPLIYGEFDNDKIVINGEFQATGNVSSPNSVIKGENTGSGTGVWGSNSNGNYGCLGSSYNGVYGKHNSSGNYGYLGSSTCGVCGYSTDLYAGYFTSNYNSSDTHVIHAEYTGTGNYNAIAVYGESVPGVLCGYGGYFEGGYRGVYGRVNPTGIYYYYYGVYGCVDGGSGTNYAIYGYADGGSTNYAGYFDGDLAYTGSLIHISDERFNENVQPFKNALSKIKLMNVHTFNFKQMEEEKQLVLPEGEQIGLIAQELEEILPELVTDNVHAYDKNEGIEGAEKDMEKIEYKGINYIGLIPVLIEAMKEQQQQIEQQQQQIEELKQQIAELK